MTKAAGLSLHAGVLAQTHDEKVHGCAGFRSVR
jgi:hypothetical protein